MLYALCGRAIRTSRSLIGCWDDDVSIISILVSKEYLSRRIAARVETDAEKRNLGQMCHAVVCRRTELTGSTMPLLSLKLSHRKLKFYTHLDGFNRIFGYEIVFARGRARGAAPLVKILDTVYISETITARKSKILQALM